MRSWSWRAGWWRRAIVAGSCAVVLAITPALTLGVAGPAPRHLGAPAGSSAPLHTPQPCPSSPAQCSGGTPASGPAAFLGTGLLVTVAAGVMVAVLVRVRRRRSERRILLPDGVSRLIPRPPRASLTFA